MSSDDRTRLRRHPERAEQDRLHEVIDQALIAHVGVPTDRGPLVLPMAIGRVGDTLYVHGAVANGLLKRGAGVEVCVTLTHVDGLVLAKSAFHHSMNYRSAVVFGPLRLVDELDEKRAALDAIVDHALPGRSKEARPSSDSELRATRVMAIELGVSSVKVRTGPPVDSEADQTLPTWSGVLPLGVRADAPMATSGEVASGALRAAVLARAPRLDGVVRLGGYVVDPDPRRLDLDRVLRWLRDESYWGAALTRESLLRSVPGALLVGAYDPEGRQVGVVRAVSDEVTIAWLGDLFVDRAHRGRGLGRALTRFVTDHPRFAGVRKWILGTRDAHGLYESLGFQRAPAGQYLTRGATSPTGAAAARIVPSA